MYVYTWGTARAVWFAGVGLSLGLCHGRSEFEILKQFYETCQSSFSTCCISENGVPRSTCLYFVSYAILHFFESLVATRHLHQHKYSRIHCGERCTLSVVLHTRCYQSPGIAVILSFLTLNTKDQYSSDRLSMTVLFGYFGEAVHWHTIRKHTCRRSPGCPNVQFVVVLSNDHGPCARCRLLLS